MLAELPHHFRAHFDVQNWQAHVESALKHVKTQYMDKGSILPLQGLVVSLFVFNYVYSLPREMAHNKHDEARRFRLHQHT